MTLEVTSNPTKGDTSNLEQPNNTLYMFIQDLIDIGKENAKIAPSEENEVNTYHGGTNLGD